MKLQHSRYKGSLLHVHIGDKVVFRNGSTHRLVSGYVIQITTNLVIVKTRDGEWHLNPERIMLKSDVEEYGPPK